jgi:DNA-binding CsgD family transcriptional regulator
MADGADCKEGFGKPQVSPAVETDLTVASPSGSTGPEIFPNRTQLEVSLFGLSRKLLALDALVTGSRHTLNKADRKGNGGESPRITVAAGLLRKCVLEIIAISKMQDSPLPEITPEILDQYESLDLVGSPFYRTKDRQKSPRNCLSRREREVVRHLAEGRCNKEIASALGLSVKTVETYRARVLIKLDAHSLNDVFRFALRNGILEF